MARKSRTIQEQDAPIAPYPQTDRNPSVLGSNITISYVSNVMRLATTGYRQQLVDLEAELIERDPHAFSVVSQRILTGASGRIQIIPRSDDVLSKSEKKRAKKIASFCQRAVADIPDLRESLSRLLWAIYYGVSCAEIEWKIVDGATVPAYLHMVHTRRIAYPDPNCWDAFIYDQGPTYFNQIGKSRTDATPYGLRIRDYESKFVLHTPSLRGDYPTREGLGRQIVFYLALKGMAVRGASQAIERFAKPWSIAKYRTRADKDPRAATKEDIDAATRAVRALGEGTLTAATLPDAVDISMIGVEGTGNLSVKDYLKFLDDQVSKCVLFTTELTDSSVNGSKSKAEMLRTTLMTACYFDVDNLSQTLTRDLIYWIVKYNFPEDCHLCPKLNISIDESPSPETAIDFAMKLAQLNAPVDIDSLADRVGVALIPNTNQDNRKGVWVGPLQGESLNGLKKNE